MTRGAAFLSIVLCTGSLVYGLATNGLLAQSITTALLGVVWMVLTLRGITRFTGLAFLVFGLISVFAVWAGVSPWSALTGMIFSLLAWDLIAFSERLKGLLDHDDIRRMERAHFLRLGLIIGLGLMGIITARYIQIDLTLGSALILALLSIWGISALVYRLRSRE